MRDIKFRGRRAEDGDWAFGYYFNGHCGDVILDISYAIKKGDQIEVGGVSVIPETVGQFTGLYDKFGNEIFEGDILEYESDNFDSDNIMTYSNGSFALTRTNGQRFYPLQNEVIGNIHEPKTFHW